eukprot:jgi/Botrbrau1/9477/Bobra.0252s0096.1
MNSCKSPCSSSCCQLPSFAAIWIKGRTLKSKPDFANSLEKHLPRVWRNICQESGETFANSLEKHFANSLEKHLPIVWRKILPTVWRNICQ